PDEDADDEADDDGRESEAGVYEREHETASGKSAEREGDAGGHAHGQAQQHRDAADLKRGRCGVEHLRVKGRETMDRFDETLSDEVHALLADVLVALPGIGEEERLAVLVDAECADDRL